MKDDLFNKLVESIREAGRIKRGESNDTTGGAAMQNDEGFEIGGMKIMGASEDDKRVLRGRDAFVQAYCAAKGWPVNPSELSWDQIMEIRSQDGWKNPEAP